MLDCTDYQKRIADEVAARYRVAVAPDVVKIVPRGVSGLPQAIWDGKNSLIYAEFKGLDGKAAVKAMTSQWRNGRNRRRGAATGPETLARRDKLSTMHAKGATDPEMAAAMGVSTNVIASDRRLMGLACNVTPRNIGPTEQTQIRMARYLEMKAAGAGREAMMADMGLTEHMLVNLVRLTGSPLPRAVRQKATRLEPVKVIRPKVAAAQARREKLRDMIGRNETKSAILAALQIGADALRKDVGLLGLAMPRDPVIARITSRDLRLARLRAAAVGDKTVAEWADFFGVIRETVAQDLRLLGLRAKPAPFGCLGQRAVDIADKKQRLVDLVRAKKTRAEITAELSIGTETLQKYLRQLGLRVQRVRAPFAAPRSVTPAILHLRAQISKLHGQGLRQVEIAERLGTSKGIICYHMRKLGLDPMQSRGGR